MKCILPVNSASAIKIVVVPRAFTRHHCPHVGLGLGFVADDVHGKAGRLR